MVSVDSASSLLPNTKHVKPNACINDLTDSVPCGKETASRKYSESNSILPYYPTPSTFPGTNNLSPGFAPLSITHASRVKLAACQSPRSSDAFRTSVACSVIDCSLIGRSIIEYSLIEGSQTMPRRFEFTRSTFSHGGNVTPQPPCSLKPLMQSNIMHSAGEGCFVPLAASRVCEWGPPWTVFPPPSEAPI